MTTTPNAAQNTPASAHYPAVDANPDFVAIEHAVLEHWKQGGHFKQSVQGRPATNADGSNNEFVFYDGPPFANGLPHYGHLLTGFVKDAFARYQTMKGKRVERRFGWDCHGLPAEMGAEKELGISGRNAIIEFGIEKFNAHCRTSVMTYTHDWEYYVTRQARWVDFAGDYKTMDTNYMESVLWAFKQLYDKGLVYESFRVMPYSWAAETPLSNFETKLDNAYRDRTDKAATVAFELDENAAVKLRPFLGVPHAYAGTQFYISAWTTTPWTLPSNLALAVQAEMKYVMVYRESIDRCDVVSLSWLKKNRSLFAHENELDGLDALENQDERWANNELISLSNTLEIVLLSGKNLIGLTYKPLFPYFAGKATNAFRILDGSSFVTDGDGTGVVHMAPGFGEEDQKCCAANGIEVVVPVDGQGKYTDEIFDLLSLPTRIETARTYLRPLVESDYAAFKSLLLDPEVSKTVSDGILPEEKIRAEFDRFVNDHARKGYSQWGVFLKDGDAFIGRAGFDNRDYEQFNTTGLPEVELRYAFLSSYWGKGFASEIGAALLAWGAQYLPHPLVTAGCADGYAPAHAVLTKLGFTAHGVVDFRTMPVRYHTLDLDAYRAAHGIAKPAPALSLKGLNVIADVRKDASEPYSDDQLKKYGLANLRIIAWLKERGQLIAQDDYKHSYPHCWRTDTPLIYRAMPSWYVAVTKIKDRMVELNQQINWIPNHIRDGAMGHMLGSAPDWSISRNRFWGTPIPIWRSNKGNLKAFGSIAELEAFFETKVEDLHRPFIDELVKTDANGETWTRVEDVFDCWFESGSMPFAQVHYPFENKDWFENHFPADFITEYVGQTRGWFNTLITLSTALFDKPPFRNCICHGVVLDAETGLKYSKRLKNYKDPREVMDGFGADALRWMMLSSPVMRGMDIAVDPDGKFIRDVVRLNIKPLWNAYNFFTLYANADGVQAKQINVSSDLLDTYILAKLRQCVAGIQSAMDAFDSITACQHMTSFVDVLNNWYIRRTRDRFWSESAAGVSADKQAAYDTLYTVLTTLCRAVAPLLPLVTEAMYRGLTGADSVHLANFPDANALPQDDALVADMDRVRDTCTAILSIRSTENIRVRQPLARATLYGAGADRLGRFLEMIADEVNVKDVAFADDLTQAATHKLSVLFPVVGKRLPHMVKQIIPAAKAGQWELLPNGHLAVAGAELLPEEFTLLLEPKEKKGAQALSSNDALVVLDLSLTPELEAEGHARDVVRMIQEMRKAQDLHIADRIAVTVHVPAALDAGVRAFEALIAEQTLATRVEWANAAGDAFEVSIAKAERNAA